MYRVKHLINPVQFTFRRFYNRHADIQKLCNLAKEYGIYSQSFKKNIEIMDSKRYSSLIDELKLFSDDAVLSHQITKQIITNVGSGKYIPQDELNESFNSENNRSNRNDYIITRLDQTFLCEEYLRELSFLNTPQNISDPHFVSICIDLNVLNRTIRFNHEGKFYQHLFISQKLVSMIKCFEKNIAEIGQMDDRNMQYLRLINEIEETLRRVKQLYLRGDLLYMFNSDEEYFIDETLNYSPKTARTKLIDTFKEIVRQRELNLINQK